MFILSVNALSLFQEVIIVKPTRDLQPRTIHEYDDLIAAHGGKPGGLLTVLECVQKATRHNYLPEPTLRYIASKMDLPLSRIYSVVTFYSFFNLRPQGDHSITVCRGTACHTRGSKVLLNELMLRLGIIADDDGEGETSFTTDDMRFTVRTVACFGQCALAPVLAVDETIYSNMTSEKVETLLKSLTKKKYRKQKRSGT